MKAISLLLVLICTCGFTFSQSGNLIENDLRPLDAYAVGADVDFFGGGCAAGLMDNEGPISVCPNDFIFVSSSGAEWPASGGYAWNFLPGIDGTGGLAGGFSITGFDETVWMVNDGVNGVMAANGLDNLAGTWTIQGYAYTDGNDAPGTACEITANLLTVIFGVDGPGCGNCDAGEYVDLTPQVIPDGQEVSLWVSGTQMPAIGGFAYYFLEGSDGTGGVAGGFSIVGSTPLESWDNDLNGILSSNGLDVLEGEWLIQPYVYTDENDAFNTACNFADGILSAYFGNNVCESILNGTSPYGPFDPIFLAVIAEIPACCDVAWDGTCESAYQDIFNGCTYPAALNYDALAGDDDGSCEFACFGDSNGDGLISTTDLLDFLSVLGDNCD